MIYQGSCHCKAVQFNVKTDLQNIKQCNCSICVRKSAKMSIIHKDDFQLTQGEKEISLYQFGTYNAKHFFCKICGIYTHHIRKSDPNGMGVNTGCLEEVNPFELKADILDNK
ncbi:MAG: hypothetical protein CFH19_00681 [Alphaproteobacteria bacterium MarineAlpha5_Bin9]|nr:MAG: hypothetical protein CFH19_00681 [Alphaproteobacteria bacterium MarineAlpha5_Bin9]|tara:strand:+ start:4016 stop:4351 length:336 start_codon:yes stop_codon:yes gene_type:complete